MLIQPFCGPIQLFCSSAKGYLQFFLEKANFNFQLFSHISNDLNLAMLMLPSFKYHNLYGKQF